MGDQRTEIQMSSQEVHDFLVAQRTAVLTTLGPTGHPHVVAMWFALLDGDIWFETKAKAQKAVNLRRDPRATVLVEDGLTYDRLRGVSLEGQAELVDDADALWAVGVDVWERYYGPYSDDVRPYVKGMLHKRLAVRLHVERTRSWDHRKLGLGPMPLGGSSAPPTSEA